jgi:phosphoenolpyruvate carboxykinase (GTP)
MGSEITAATISNNIGQVRRDPFAMLPFFGYNVCDYLTHWLEIGEKTTADKLPKIFYVNWFRKDPDGNFLWPGFGDNSRVLEWVFERILGGGTAIETPIGIMPTPEALDISGLKISHLELEELLEVNIDEWLREVESIKLHYENYGEKLPEELHHQLVALEERLNKTKRDAKK